MVTKEAAFTGCTCVTFTKCTSPHGSVLPTRYVTKITHVVHSLHTNGPFLHGILLFKHVLEVLDNLVYDIHKVLRV